MQLTKDNSAKVYVFFANEKLVKLVNFYDNNLNLKFSSNYHPFDSKISKYVTNNKKSIAVRFPKHKLFRNLLKNLDYPVAAPSANISTKLSSVEASDVKDEFGSRIKYVMNGGRCKIGVESTILNLINKPTLLRFGGLEISKIERVLKKKISIKNLNRLPLEAHNLKI